MTISRRDTLKLGGAGLVGLPLLATSAQAASHEVLIQGFAFNPPALNIAVGDTVAFLNRDSAPHTATATNGAFDTGRLNAGQAVQLTFSSAGAFEYTCEFHPNMRGVITAG